MHSSDRVMERNPEDPRGDPVRGRLTRPQWLAPLLGVSALGLAGWLLHRQPPPQGALPGLLVVLVVLVMVLLWRLWQQQQVLARLQEGLQDAQDGELAVIPLPAQGGGLRELVADYNRTMSALKRVFSTVEECQNRVVDERNRIGAVLQSLPGALLSVDDDLCVNGVNARTEAMFGRIEAGIVGSSLFDLLALGDRDRDLLRDAFLYKRSISNQEIECELRGQPRHLSLNLSFVTKDAADMGAVITLQDISDYKRLQENLYSQDKLVAMGELAAGVAYELNTPLGSVLGYAQLLRDSVRDDPKVREWTRVICDEARRCSRSVDDLLQYARGDDKCNRDICELNAMVRNVAETFVSCRMKRYQIRVEWSLGEQEIPVEGGCGQLEIVLVNLLSNAIQALAGQSDGHIRLHTRVLDAERAQVIVEDNGPGVARENRARIFDPFFTTKEVGTGSGLGLAICQAMLRRRGGTIRLDPEARAGARFIVELPRLLPAAGGDGVPA